MKISGLSNQWKTRDQLLDAFSPHPDEWDPITNELYRIVQKFLLQLESLEGPDLWIGTSHRGLNFCRSDTKHQFDHIPSFVTLETFEIQREPPVCGYRIGFSLTGACWEYHDIVEVSEAAEMVLRLMKNTPA